VSLLLFRLAGLIEKWIHLVTVEVNYGSFTDYPSETIELKVEPNVPVDMVKWLVVKKVNLQLSAITVRPRHSKHEEGVDFVVNVPSPDLIHSPDYEPPLNPLSPHQSSYVFIHSILL